MKNKKAQDFIFGPTGLVILIILISLIIGNWGSIKSYVSSSLEENSLNITCTERYDIFMDSENIGQRTYLYKHVKVNTLDELKRLEEDYSGGFLGGAESGFYGPSDEFSQDYSRNGKLKDVEFEPTTALIINYEGNEHYFPQVRVCICHKEELIC
jgi:hypothetical protein